MHVYLVILAKISSLRKRKSSSPSNLSGSPPYSGKKTLSPTATETGTTSPSRVLKPGPTARTSPSWFLEMLDSGSKIPPAVYAKISQRIQFSLTYSSSHHINARLSVRTWPKQALLRWSGMVL